MYKLFALPLLFCIGVLFIAATSEDSKDTPTTTTSNYDLLCMDVELKTQAVRCFGFCDGVLEVVVTGGQEPYIYQWSNGLTTNFSATLPAGEFSVTVTDAGGCEVVATATVGSPAEIKPNLEIGGSCDENTPIVASVSPVGGVGNYSIEWSTGETGRSISGLKAGETYGVTITTGGNGCSVSEEFTVAEGLTIDTEKIDIACGNPNTGSATATALSGQAPYTFQWSNGILETSDNSSTIENLAVGTYTVTVTDASGCETTETIEVSDDGGLNLEIDSAPTTCKGDTDGMANVIPSGGMAPYRFAWSDGQTTGSAINLAAGTYSVTVTDIMGCEQVGTVVVESTSNIEVSVTANTSNGSVTIMAMGGVAPYTYLWSNGETTATSTGYEAGDEYSITVTDALGCQETITNKFPPDSGQLNIEITPTAPTCPMFTNGGLETNVSGGVPPYTYKWSTGQMSASISGLEEGTYGVTVTDADGATASSNITLTSPGPITVNIEPTSGDICDGSSTDYEAMVTGGTAPYTYAWSNGNTSSTLVNVEPGDYFLTVTDANNCEKIAYLKVRPPFDVKVIGQAVRCADFCDGSVRAMVTGGKAPFTYVWSNGQTGQILEALPPGSYTVTVTDDNGCEVVATGEVTAPPAIEANLRVEGTCESGSDITANVNPTGGVGNYTILWSTGETGTSIANLERGQTYTVKITDGNGCSITERFTIPRSVGLVLQGEKTDIACGDSRGGSATVTVLSGTSPYTYDWIGLPDVTTDESSNTIDDLAQGTYRVTVTDDNGCRGIQTFVIEKKQNLILGTGSTPSTCEDSPDGMANVVPIGGIAPYTYLWSDGQTTGTAINVTPGDYTVTVTDSRGCQGVATVTVEAGDGYEVEVTANVGDGSITATPSGGTAPYTYEWDNGESTATATGYAPGDEYSVKVTDANGCMTTVTGKVPGDNNPLVVTVETTPTCEGENDGTATLTIDGGTPPYMIDWGEGATSDLTNTGLAAGTYTVTVTDADGRIRVIEYTIESNSVDIDATSTPETCGTDEKGTATVNINSGTAPFEILWSNGEETQTINNLEPGEYSVTVVDANGCEDVTTVVVESDNNIEVAIDIDINTNAVSATPSGGTGPYTFMWDNGERGATAFNYQPGDMFSVKVTDANGCMKTVTGKIPVDENPLVVTIETTPTCEGENDGTATLTIDGGTPPYTIDWGEGETDDLTNTGLAGGTYTVTVTDADGRTKVIEYTIEEISVDIVATSTPQGCGMDEKGIATVTINGGDAPYTITWSNGENTETITDLEAGEYSVTVVDANGCEDVTTVVVESENKVVVIATVDRATNAVTAMPSGGTEPYTFEWDNGETGMTAFNYQPGDVYTVKVTDANGCMTTFTGTVPEDENPLDVTIETTPTCEGENDGTATLTINGGTPPYMINWGEGETEDLMNTGLAGGTYTVTVTDTDGRTEVIEYTIEEISIDIVATSTPEGCGMDEKGTATVGINGGDAPYTITWSNGESTETITDLEPGEYSVTVVDANGCEDITTVVVGTENNVQVDISIDEDTNAVTATPSGGTAPYTFEWDNGETGATATGYGPVDMFSVKVTDANGCMRTVTGKIPENDPLMVTVETTPTCEGESDGTATLTITGGTEPYMIDWRNGNTDITNTGLAGGSYIVTVTDAEGESEVVNYTIEEISVEANATATPEICGTDEKGTASVNPMGGDTPYMILWNTGDTTEMITNLDPGEYTVTVTDANGCQDIQTVVVESQVNIIAEVTVDTTNNSVTVTPSGGTEPYTYMWDNGETGATAFNYEPGDTYSVKITDANGCMKTITGMIPDNRPVVTITTTPTCEGEMNGSATLNISGGVQPYTIDWGNDVEGDTNSGLAAGTYTVTVTDAAGNSREVEYIIEEIILDIEVAVTPKQCGSDEGGSATVEIDGGDEPYTIRWSTEESEIKISDLEIGEYTVTVIDANGCEKEETFTVGEESSVVATVETTKTDCAQATGTASVQVTMGREPFTYLWNDGSVEQLRSDLAAGEYSVTVTDANGCETTLTTVIEEDNDIVVTTSKVDANCQAAANGSASIEIEGGNEPYTIEWITGDDGLTAENLVPGEVIVTVTDNEGCQRTTTIAIGEDNDLEVDINVTINGMNNGDTGSLTASATGGSGNFDNYTYLWCTGVTTATISDLITGAYTVTVTDENGCDQTQTGYINTPPALEIMPNCDGTANVRAIIGGCEELEVTWDNNTSGVETVIDNGEHTVTVTLPNGEVITSTFEVDAPILTADATAQVNATCDDSTDGSATVTPMGGTTPYTYKWDDEAGTESATAENLAPGTYTVTVTDANDCETTVSVTIEAEQAIDATVNGAMVCEGEEAGPSIINNNEDQTLTYQWSPADLFEDATTANPNFIGMEDASVTVLITNEAGCTKEETVEIMFTDRSVPNVDNITYEESCLGLKVDFNGGSEVNGYIWRFGDPNNSNDISSDSNPTYTYSETGTYTVTLIPADGAACQDTAKFEIVVEGEEELDFDITGDPMVCGQTNGLYSVDDANLTVKWFDAADLENPLGEFNSIDLMPGDYVVEVMNAEGCTGTQLLTVMNSQVNIELEESFETCAGDELPIEVFNLNEGDILTYDWMPNNPDLIDLSNPSMPVFTLEETTTFTSTITNQFGCSITREITIEVGEQPQIDSLIADDYTIVLGQSTNLRILGGDPNYTYTWFDDTSLGSPTREVEPMQTTTYTVEIMSEDGCIIIRTVTVEVLDLPCEEPYIFIPNAFTPNGDGNNDVIRVEGPHIEELRLEIYNRWGELVFETDDVDGEWDGTYRGEIAEGRVFGYVLMVRCIGGDTFEKKGNITLLR
ncbi:MAG: gliding motility-associated C-terminal domain-containing protein [Bacteroidota bacterium]